MGKTYLVKDISDGNDIAIVTSSFYLNCFPIRHSEFIQLMLEENKDIKHNFTMLCLKWFKSLAAVNYYDDRNEDSVFLARAIAVNIPDEAIVFRRINKNNIPIQAECNWRSDKDMQMLIKNHLIIADGFDSFIKHMLDAHRTLQQNFSRFCLDWFEAVSEREKGKKTYIQLAAQVNEHKKPLRYI